MHVLIFANGDLQPVEWVRPYLQQATAIIAANGGTQHILDLGTQPDVIIGDLDSLDPDARAKLQDASVRLIQANADKDETDLELALLYATENYELPVLIIAGLGGRIDQMFANILLLMHPRLLGRDISFKTEYQQIWLTGEHTTIEGNKGDTVSLIPLGGDVFVESTRGLRWSLNSERLVFGPARGVSNVMVEEVASVSIGQGHLLCVHTQREWQR